MDLDMRPLCNLQHEMKETISKAKLNFNKASNDRISEAYIETRLNHLEEQWRMFMDTHRTIVTDVEVSDYKRSSYYTENVYEDTQELYINYKSDLKERLASVLDNKSIANDTSQSKSQVKLPKITIPIFSGKYTEWTTFKELFLCLVHNNPNLDNVQKHYYLKTYLTGEAEQLLRHIPVSNENYSEAWALLNRRFSNKKYLTNILLKRMISQPSVSSESSIAIRELLDTTVDCLNGLKNQGVNIDSWDVIIIHLISSKLDLESRKLWEARVTCSDDYPTIPQFKEFLRHRFHSLEFLSSSPEKPNPIQVNVNHVTTVVCPFCSESHRLNHCKLFTNENVNSRRSFVQAHSLCYNCFVPGHCVFSCRKISRCRICKKKHHSLLHISGSIVENQSDLKSKDIKNNVMTYQSSHSSSVLLPTSLVKVMSQSGNPVTLRSMLDQGSEVSFISVAAVKSLGLKKIPTRTLISGVGNPIQPTVSDSIVNFQLQSIHDPSFNTSVKAHVLNNLTSFVPSSNLSFDRQHLDNIKLADPYFHISNKVDVILGADTFSRILGDGLLKYSSGLVAQNTRLGWVLSGRCSQ